MAYTKYANPTFALVSGLAAAGYYMSGWFLARGEDKMGHDLATLTSAGIVSFFMPKAYATGATYESVLSTLGAVSVSTGAVKSYQARSGKPKFHKLT